MCIHHIHCTTPQCLGSVCQQEEQYQSLQSGSMQSGGLLPSPDGAAPALFARVPLQPCAVGMLSADLQPSSLTLSAYSMFELRHGLHCCLLLHLHRKVPCFIGLLHSSRCGNSWQFVKMCSTDNIDEM